MKIGRESLRQLPERNALLRLCHRVRSALKNGLLPPERLGNLDLRKEKTRPLTKRALLSYIVHPFATLPDATRLPASHQYLARLGNGQSTESTGLYCRCRRLQR